MNLFSVHMHRCILLISNLLFIMPGASGQDIHEAARSGDVKAVSELIAADSALLSARTPGGSIPLHFAAINPDTSVAAYLLVRGSDVNAVNSSGYTPLHYAASYDRPSLVRLLVGHGAHVEARSLEKETPLHLAAAAGAVEAGKVLLARGADPEALEARNRTPLLVNARESGAVPFGRLLLEYDVDLNVADRYGATALELAAWRGYRPFVRFLLRAGAELPSSEESRNNLLKDAVKKNIDSLFFVLVGEGLDLGACALATPDLINLAAAGGSVEMTRLLLDHGFSVRHADPNGWTPLHHAAEFDRSELVQTLLRKGASINARTLAGETAYNIALFSSATATAALLESMGCDTENPLFPYLDGPYFAQSLPGAHPEVFAPGIVSGHYKLHSSISFSPDGSQAAWSIMVPPRDSGYGSCHVLHSSLTGGRWHYPAPLSEDPSDVPFFSPAGNRLYYISRSPAYENGPRKENIWYRDVRATGFSEPVAEARAVNDNPIHWQFSLDKEGTIFFGTGDGRILCSSLEEGIRQDPAPPGQTDANVTTGGGSPCISPDGEFLLFVSNGDIYITFRKDAEHWSEAVPLDQSINTPSNETCPMLSPDGALLFFNREWKVYWVSIASSLETYREQLSNSRVAVEGQ